MNNTEIKKRLFHPKTNKQHFLAQLKMDSNYNEFKKIIKGIKQHPFGRYALNSTPIPKSPSDLRKNNIIPHSGNIQTEIAWIVDSILENSELINKYVELKEEYENSFLLNQYDKSEEILNKIEKEICFSIWGAENRLLLTEEKLGTESNWLLLDDYLKNIKDPLSQFLIEQSSKKAENKFSYVRYKNNFESIIEGTNESLQEYLCFKIIYPGYTGFQNFSFLINIESVSSIIDRYNLLMDILIELVPLGQNDFLLIVAKDLSKKISNDIRIKQLMNLLSDEYSQLPLSNQNISIVDCYSKGEYLKCITETSNLLIKHPSIVELYIIYVKSIIEEKLDFQPLNISENINEILLKLYNIYSVSNEFNSSIEDILKISLKYFSFNFGKQLFGVISKEANLNNVNNIHQLHYVLNSKFSNPKILNYISKLDVNIFNKTISDFKRVDNISAQINIAISQGNYNDIAKLKNVSNAKKELYYVKALLNSNDNHLALDNLEKIISSNQHSIITKKEIIEMLFNIYISKKETEKALTLYVDSFFENKNLVSRLSNDSLLGILKDHNTQINTIDLPIFFYISTPDIYEQYVKYDEFLESKNIERPIELFSSEIKENKLVFFLKEVCNIDIMHHSLYFEGTDDIENERIEILKHLLSIDTNNETEYIKEITEITQKTKIRKAIREVNKGRITINTQQIKNKEENNIKDNFLRFKELVVFSNNHNIKSLDLTSKMLNDYFSTLEDKSMRDKIVNINDPAFISFKTMFIDLRDKFILSKDFGLDGYLSTRIRHGTFLNHIRSVFESYYLVSQKKNDTYIQNEFWLNKTPITLNDKKSDIQNEIKEFSKQIDNFTEYIIRELIQIKTEKNSQRQNAFFDFSLDNKTLAYLFQESKNSINTHTSFLNFVFEYLEAIIEIKLREIRAILKNDIKDEYIKLINSFDKKIRTIIKEDSFIDITSSISKCQTDIINELENISEWFNISNPSSDLVLDVQTIIQTSLEITNTIYPNENIIASIKEETNLPFASGTTNLIYIIRILLDNIIKHSGLVKSKRNVAINSKIIDDKILKISISNDFDPKIIDKIETALKEVKTNWEENRDDYSKINIEGGSGFDKIRRILAVDMQMKNCAFDYEIKRNNLNISISLEISIYQTEK
ncbi:hypothetical protein [Cellulophaga omnivescoria]|uniref:hypothetical protein n=1 Tax=Cellulophaga omnivescoria TaxID=1888890 RepID=UPI003EB6BF98